jgi:hypothetical protein
MRSLVARRWDLNALTIIEPWASLIADQRKIGMRPCGTEYQCLIAMHADFSKDRISGLSYTYQRL